MSYLRYYALLVLGDAEPALDLIPERRAAVRADGGERPDAASNDETDAGDTDTTEDGNGSNADE
ncbi:hypothetical protein ACFQRB_20675 [Halobaculum litoreum]|uniref:Uncharacterized protein n=1 Tax=Halobaculum litoreum TaxID=3031998 RepID=A0ABD5XX78_9EURY